MEASAAAIELMLLAVASGSAFASMAQAIAFAFAFAPGRIRHRKALWASIAMIAGGVCFTSFHHLTSPQVFQYHEQNFLLLAHALVKCAIGVLLLMFSRAIRQLEMELSESLDWNEEMRSALERHQTDLQSILEQRTDSLRREIRERRRVQKNLQERAQAQHDELQAAGNLQRALQPHETQTVFGRSRYFSLPMADVTGDTCVVAADDQQFVITLADAMGHGVPAALVTQSVQALSARYKEYADGVALLKDIDRTLNSSSEVLFATAMHCRVQADGQVQLHSAGAPPLVWIRAADRSLHLIGGPSSALGLFELQTEDIFEHQWTLAPGDVLFLYTDGILEQRTPQGQLYGTQGICTWLGKHLKQSQDAAELADLAMADLRMARKQGWVNDDLSFLAFEYQGPAGAEPTTKTNS
nr:serine/threonine-protein phosphatase [Oceanococcus sp. HetDA_MAG_MS8]